MDEGEGEGLGKGWGGCHVRCQIGPGVDGVNPGGERSPLLLFSATVYLVWRG